MVRSHQQINSMNAAGRCYNVTAAFIVRESNESTVGGSPQSGGRRQAPKRSHLYCWYFVMR